jgi:hypothetical protein
MVMILVLTFMLSVPFFTISSYNDDTAKFTYGLQLVSKYYPE